MLPRRVLQARIGAGREDDGYMTTCRSESQSSLNLNAGWARREHLSKHLFPIFHLRLVAECKLTQIDQVFYLSKLRCSPACLFLSVPAQMGLQKRVARHPVNRIRFSQATLTEIDRKNIHKTRGLVLDTLPFCFHSV